MHKPSIITAYSEDTGDLLVSILSSDPSVAEAIGSVLQDILTHLPVGQIQPGDTIAADGTVFVAMAPESERSEIFLRRAAAQGLGRDLPATPTLRIIDRADDLVCSGLARQSDIPDPENATWVLEKQD